MSLALLWLAGCAATFVTTDDLGGDDDTDVADTEIDEVVETDVGVDTEVVDETDTVPEPVYTEPIVVEVCDSPDGWKFVELYNPTPERISLDGWTLNKYSNGARKPTSEIVLDDEDIASKATFVIAFAPEVRAFVKEFDADPDLESFAVDGNGNDVYALADDGDVVDVYGEIGVDGAGEAWDYEDTCARRVLGADEASDVWSADDWDVPSDPMPFDRE